MYSRRHSMSRPRGGITGFGYGNSLGGLLLGGALKDFYVDGNVKAGVRNDKSDELFAFERARLDLINQKAAARRLKKRLEAEERGTPLRALKGQRGVRNTPEHMRNMLKRLIDAEKMGAQELLAKHPMEARYLDEDALYNMALYDSETTPKFFRDKFSSKYYNKNNYASLFPRPTARGAMSEEQKARLRAGKEAARGQQKFVYINSNGVEKILTAGTKAFATAAGTKRVQENPQLLLPIA